MILGFVATVVFATIAAYPPGFLQQMLREFVPHPRDAIFYTALTLAVFSVIGFLVDVYRQVYYRFFVNSKYSPATKSVKSTYTNCCRSLQLNLNPIWVVEHSRPFVHDVFFTLCGVVLCVVSSAWTLHTQCEPVTFDTISVYCGVWTAYDVLRDIRCETWLVTCAVCTVRL